MIFILQCLRDHEIDCKVAWLWLSKLQQAGLSTSTIWVCKWSVAKILSLAFGLVFEHMFKDIDRGMVTLQVPKVEPCKWSVGKVVRYLVESSNSSLEFITQKALFLFSVAFNRCVEDGLASLRTKYFFYL